MKKKELALGLAFVAAVSALSVKVMRWASDRLAGKDRK